MKKSNLKYCILLSAAILLALPAFSAEYFVSNLGVNSNSGTIGNPFKTISYAISKIKGGDIIFVRDGTYNEQVILYGLTGTELNRTTVSAYNGEIVIIDGTDIHPGDGSGLVRSFSQYTQFIGLTVRNSDQYGITLDQNNAAYSIVSNCTVYNCMKTGIGAWTDYCTVKDCIVYNVSLNNVNGVLPVGWGCGISCHGASSLHLTGCIVRHNIVHDAWGEGIIVAWGTDCVVEDNIVYDNFSVGIYNRNSQNTLNQRNFVYTTKVMNGGSQVGLGHWNEGNFTFINQNNTFRNNIVSGCKRNFFYYDATNGLMVVNNTFVNSTGFACVDIDDRSGMTNSLFANNIVIQENNLPGILVEDGSGLIFLNNLYNKSHSNSAGAGDVTDDPRFIKGNVENADYFKLLRDSPAIDKGSTIPGITDDFFGNRRDIIDIGACEYMKITSINAESTKLNIIVENHYVRVSAEDSGVANLINFKGTLISSKIVNSGVVIFDTSSLLPGIYIIVYYNRNSLITKKFIVSK